MIVDYVTLAAALGALAVSALTLRAVDRLEQSIRHLRAIVGESIGKADLDLLKSYADPTPGSLHVPEGFERRFHSDEDDG